MIKKLLIYNSGGGIGDSIQLFPLILSLENLFEKSEIYYLGAHENHYLGGLKEYNIKVKTLNLGLKYFGFRWWHLFVAKKNFYKLKLDKFDLIIDCQSKFRNTVILKQIPSKTFYSSTFNNMFCSRLEKPPEEFWHDLKKVNYNIKNIPRKYFDESVRLLPNQNYIGFSLTQGNVYRKKSWPIKNFINLAKKIIEIKKIPVFFVEKTNLDIINQIKSEIPESLFPELDSKLSGPPLVTALSTRLEKAVSIDNGVMHMISLANIPMVILFGPTDSEKFAPNYKKVIILDSKKLYNSDDISQIKIEDVQKHLI